jgi:hypothetical protein
MIIERSIKVGDILTSLTILVSICALIISLSKDRLTKEKEQADKVRAAAAKALIQLDRWQYLNLSIYQELQPTFVETSEMLCDDFDVIKARDYLWKAINSQRTRIASKILDEKIMTAYVDLLSHFPASRNYFLKVFEELRLLEEDVSGRFIEASQKDVMFFEGKEQKNYTSAILGNMLRTTAMKHKKEFVEKYTENVRSVRQFLFDVIVMSDKELLYSNRVLPNN